MTSTTSMTSPAGPERRTWLLLGAIVIIALVLDVWFYTGFFASDDTEYIHGIHGLVGDAVGGPPVDLRPGLGNSRLGIILPGGLAYWLSGGSIDAIAWFHVIYHLGLVILAFALGRLLRGDTTGLFAALLVAGNPLFVLYAGAVLPDNATAFWLGLAMLALETMRRRATGAGGPLTTWRAFSGYFAGGLALGVAYACKETALIMTIPAAVWVIAAAPRLRDPVWIRNGAFLAAGLLAFMIIETIGLRVIMGEWVWRLGIVQGGGDTLALRMEQQGTTPFERFGFAYERRLAPFAPLSIWLVVVGVVGYVATRSRSIGLLAFFWWPLLYITIGSTSFTSYRPPGLQTRYYSIVLLPAMIMVAALLAALLRRWSDWPRLTGLRREALWRRLPAVLAALAILLMIRSEANLNASRAGNLYRATMVRSFVAAYELARAEYPQYPIVLSRCYRRRMTPVFFPQAPDDVQAGSTLTPWEPPEPPFLYIGPITEEQEANLEADHGEVALHTLEMVYAPASRGDILADELRTIFGVTSSTPMARTRHRASVIYLVTEPGERLPGLGAASGSVVNWVPPWVALNRRARISDLADGAFVSWQDDEAFYVQLFDGLSYKKPPTLPAARLADRPGTIALELDLRLTRGDRIHLAAHVYGYHDNGELAHATASVTLARSDTFTPVRVELHGDAPMASYRVRLKIVPVASAGHRGPGGGLHIRAPRVVDLDSGSPPEPEASVPAP